MKHLITTYCNSGKGDFLVQHWLRSLKENVDLTGIDVMVIDFGLSPQQRKALGEQQVVLNPQVPDGRLSNIHYRHVAEYLHSHPFYDQVLYSDCGDIVFQSDISMLFDVAKDKFRAALEPEFNYDLHRLTLGVRDIKEARLSEIRRVLGPHPTMNGGLLIGPAKKMGTIWNEYSELCCGTAVHGTDQLVISYILRRDGFEELPRKYNYVTFLNGEHFHYNDSHLLCNSMGIIPVVHNAGRFDFARAISNFGYRQGQVKPRVVPLLFRTTYAACRLAARFF